MFKQLKEGFVASGSINAAFESDGIRYQVVKLAARISCQVRETGSAVESIDDVSNFDKPMAAAFAELVTTELLYYYQLGEIGCYLASTYSDEENQKNQTNEQPEQFEEDEDSEEEDEDDGCDYVLQRTMSSGPAPAPAPAPAGPVVNQLSANLLIASGRVRQEILKLAMFLGISVEMFGAASFQSNTTLEKRHFYGLLVHQVFVFIGGKSDTSQTQNGEPFYQRRGYVLDAICEISKMAWTLMNLCAMTNTFQFETDTPLFNTIKINHIESVFGNKRWRAYSECSCANITTPVADSHDSLLFNCECNHGETMTMCDI
jgi:hypothetical protein